MAAEEVGELRGCHRAVDAGPMESVSVSEQRGVPGACLAKWEGHGCSDSRGVEVVVVVAAAVAVAVAVVAVVVDAVVLKDAEDDVWSWWYASRGSGTAMRAAAGRWATAAAGSVPKRVGGQVSVIPSFRDDAVSVTSSPPDCASLRRAHLV